MRILIADTYYEPFLAAHGASAGARGYEELLASLMERSFGTGDAYSAGFRELGHEAAELVLNWPELQRAWARKRRAPAAAATRAGRQLPGRLGAMAAQAELHLVALRQIEEFEPDVLYLQNLWFFSPRELRRLRRRGTLIAGQIASRPPSDEVLRSYDVLFTSLPNLADQFRSLGVTAHDLPIAFDERVLDRLRAAGVDPAPESPRDHAVTMVGGLDPATHDVRVELLDRVAPKLPLEIWGYGAEALPASSPIRERYRGEAWGLEMYEILARSKIVINVHERVAGGNANNMRLFEATGAGALLVTDRTANLDRFFAPGREVVAFEDADDLVAKVRHHLEHDDERVAIAAAGQERTLSEHTYRHRIGELAEMLEAELASRRPG